MRKVSSFFAIIFFVFPVVSHGAGWSNQFGLSYISGINEVVDIYQDNLEQSGYRTEEVSGLPFGASYSGHYQYESGFLIGGGFGPLFLILGDVRHMEFPVNGKIGWSFFNDYKLSPFIGIGLSKHIVSGDYVEDDNVGALMEVGFTYNSFGVKLARDTSEVIFQSVEGNQAINSYETIITLFFEF